MAILPPDEKWKRIAFGKGERIWLFLIILMIIMMAALTVGWVFLGPQNPPEKFERISPEDFKVKAASENAKITTVGQVTDKAGNSHNGLIANSGGDIYLFGAGTPSWQWRFYYDNTSTFYSAIQLKKGQTYSFHISGDGALHGFEIIDFSISIQIVPGYDYILDFTPTTSGKFLIVCNEFCGTGHQTMAAVLTVVD